MFQHEDNAAPDLETTNYRVLQAEAKKLGLPCNVKKVHLIDMIRAKRYCSDMDLKVIVDRIKMERKINGMIKKKLKKKRLQGTEISSTSQSPPLSLTPKRSDFVFQYNPDMGNTAMDYQLKPNILRTGTSILQPLKQQSHSDRVLRSSNSVSRLNYRVFEQSNYFDSVKSQKTLQETVQEIRRQRLQKLDELHKEHSQKLMSIQRLKRERQLLPMLRSSNIMSSKSSLLRTRRISGFYPLPQDNATFDISPTVVRRSNGKLTKINAVVQKLHSHALAKKQMSQPQPNLLQGVINCAVQYPSTAKSLNQIKYPNKVGYQIAKQPTAVEPFNQTRKNMFRAIECSEADQSNPNIYMTDIFGKAENQMKTAAKVIVQRNSQLIEYQNGQISNVDDIFGRAENQGMKTAAKVVVQRNSQLIEYQNGQISSNIDETLVLQSIYNQQVPKQGCNMEYQNENRQRQWKVYDINGQSLNSTEIEQFHSVFEHNQSNAPVSTHHKLKNIPAFIQKPKHAPVSTYKPKAMVRVSNMQVVKKLPEPLSRDNQSEYKKFKQELCKTKHTKRNCAIVKPNDSRKPILNQRKRFNPETHRDQTYPTQQQNSGLTGHQIQDFISYTYQNQVTSVNLVSQNALYPNMQAMSDHGYSSSHQVFNHKEMRSEQVQHMVLPKINDAFTQFNYSRLTQPLYVQVSQEYDIVPLPLNRADIGRGQMLETIYNFKSQFVMNPPLLAIAPAKTECTYSCKTVTTPLAQSDIQLCINTDPPTYRPPSLPLPPPPPPPPANTYQSNDTGVLPGMILDEPLLTHAECDEVLSSWSTTSVDVSQNSQNDDNSTVLDMMEELISQDGEYIERIIKLDVTIKCIVCDWIGFKSTLEHHIQQNHVEEIQQPLTPEWSVLLTLGELLPRQSWASQLARFGDELYAVSAKYSHDDAILIALSIIPNQMDTDVEIIRRGRITVYNKISGKPYTFEGEIHHIPDCMPDECNLDCLSVKIGDLDLMPNSANLKLVNTELVGTPDKVIFGQPQLNEVEIIVYVKLFD